MCIFCKIARGEEKAYVVYENENVIAFLDINPLSKGHTLIVPKNHYENYIEIPSEVSKDLHDAIKNVCEKLKAFKPAGFNIITNIGRKAGQIVMHAHVHVIPRYEDEIGKPIEFGRPIEVNLDEVYKALV